MEKFSSTLKIGDGFEDFISPGLECIKPINTRKTSNIEIKSKGLKKVEVCFNKSKFTNILLSILGCF